MKVIDPVAKASLGDVHIAILKPDGSLWMSGSNYHGQLGDGTTTDKKSPIKIMSYVKDVSARGNQTAIIKTDGTLWMCGSNSYQIFGDGITLSSKPVRVM